jgi:hypothetical protein
LFFASPKKSTQKKGDPQSATPSLGEGANLRRVGCGVRRGTRFAAAQRRSDNRGESVHEAAAHLRGCHPATAPAQAQSEGVGHRTAEQPTAEQPHGSSLRSTRQGRAQREALAPAKLGRAKQWPERMSAPPSPLYAPRSAAGGVARVPKDTRAS